MTEESDVIQNVRRGYDAFNRGTSMQRLRRCIPMYGKAGELEFFADRSEALAAAGLS